MDKAEDRDHNNNATLHTHQSAFYNALRSNNVEAISKLFEFSETENISLLSFLSEGYEEAKFKNIPLSKETQFLVESKFIDFQFISSGRKSQIDKFRTSFEDIASHLDFACNLINSFLQKYKDTEFDINMDFIFHARYIAQHISVLKRRLNFTYETLPWEEMQFCLVIYLHTLLNPQNSDIIYKLIISRSSILNYLFHFYAKLNETKLHFKEKDLERKKEFRKNLLKESILKSSPVFKNLYKDFSLLRDIYSLERINFYINKALAVDTKGNIIISQLVIERTIQVMGEYIKNTAESPNLSDDLYRSLLKAAPRNLRNILVSLRNMLSHSFSLNRKLEMESSKDPDFFTKIQNDLKKIQIDIIYILYKQKIEAIKLFLYKLLDTNNSEELIYLSKQNSVKHIDEVSGYAIEMDEYLKVKTLVSSFCEKILEESDEDTEAINDIINLLAVYEKKIENVSFTYVEVINNVFNLVGTQPNLDKIKNIVRTYLSQLSASEPQSLFKDIFLKLRHIYENYKTKKNFDPENFLDPDEKTLEIGNIIIQIYHYLKWKLRTVKWIEEMEDILTLKEEISEKENTAQEIMQIILRKVETDADRTLVKIAVEKAQQHHFTKYELMNYLDEDSKTFQIKVESLGLSAKRQKEILDNHKNSKTDKLLLMIKQIDDNYGTFLKNLGDIFPLAAYVNSIKSFYKSLKLKKPLQIKVDKAIEDAIHQQIKNCYSQRLHMLEICINDKRGVRNLKTDEHLTVSLEMLVLDLLEFLEKFGILGDNKMLLVEDTPILIGKQLRNYLAHGDILTDILPYDLMITIVFHAENLVKISESILDQKGVVVGFRVNTPSFCFQQYFEKCLGIISNQIKLFDDVTNGTIQEMEQAVTGADIFGINHNGWTVLHFAIDGNNQHFFKHLIEEFDFIELTEVYRLLKFAIALGNLDTTEYLVKELQIDVNHKFNNGQTLLHVALEHCQQHIAKFLIKNGVKINDKDSTGKTSLHYASENGCLDIVRLVLDNCNDVIDLATDDSSTALHLAAQNGHSKVVKILLINHAKIDTKNSQGLTAFQAAAQRGHANMLEFFLGTSGYVLDDEDLTRALYLATQNGHCLVIKTLLQRINNSSTKIREINNILHIASQYGHLDIIKKLIDIGVDVYFKDVADRTALHLASQCGHAEVVKFLLDCDVDPNNIDNEGWTALHFATCNKHTDIVKLILSKNCNIHIRDKEGKNVFHLAAQNGDLDMLKTLNEFKADATTTTANGRTALHLVAQNGHHHLVDTLINIYKVDINTRDNNDETALIVASDNGHNDVVELLLKLEAKINYKSKKEGYSALTVATSQGHFDIFLNLIKYKADIEIEENSGWRPLHLAVQNGYSDILGVLLKYGVEVNAKYGQGGTALHTAVASGHTNIVKKLIKHKADIKSLMLALLPLRVAANFGYKDIAMLLLTNGAEVDEVGSDRVTPLHTASWRGHLEMVKLLIQNGADVNRKNEEEWTALHFAVKYGFIEIVQVLLDNCADMYVENNFGATVFHTACQMGHNDIVTMLLHIYNVNVNLKGSNGATGLHWASANKHINVVETLINNNADVNINDNDESTALHWAADNSGTVLVVRALIRNGAGVNITDVKGTTPLQLASIKGNTEVVNALLVSGADVNAINKNISSLNLAVALGHEGVARILLSRGAIVDNITLRKKTNLHIAVEKGYKDIVWILLETGINLNLEDENGSTALHLAVQNHYEDVTRWLLECKADANILDHKKRSALSLALEQQCEDIALLLIENNAKVQREHIDGYTYLHRACRGGMLKVVLALLEYKADVNASSYFTKSTPLHESLSEGYDQICSILIENKADVNAATSAGWTALHISAGKGFENIVLLLIARGADIGAQTKDAETPLFFASLQGHSGIVAELLRLDANVNVKTLSKELTALNVAAQEGHSKILKTLIHHHADINSKDNQGLTSLHLSALYGHKECVEILLENGADINAVTTTLWSALHMAAFEGYIDIVAVLLARNITVVDDKTEEGVTAVDLAQKQGHKEIVASLLKYRVTKKYFSIHQ